MKIPKAIEILDDLTFGRAIDDPNDHRDALQMGIEALKAIQLQRAFAPSTAIGWLPGETKD